MPSPRQMSFLKEPAFKNWNRREHGGSLGVGKRKTFRPVDTRRPMHLVLRSSRAKGEYSMLRSRFEKRIRSAVYRYARENGVKVRQYANSGNHLHLLVQARTREGFQRFLKAAAGVIARIVTGAKKGSAFGRFWDALAYSRVVEWGRAYFTANYYVIQNEMEAAGVWYRPKPGG
jgi:REP element-mobilizing transposase RayT